MRVKPMQILGIRKNWHLGERKKGEKLEKRAFFVNKLKYLSWKRHLIFSLFYGIVIPAVRVERLRSR